jgi:hypothetical protein
MDGGVMFREIDPGLKRNQIPTDPEEMGTGS